MYGQNMHIEIVTSILNIQEARSNYSWKERKEN